MSKLWFTLITYIVTELILKAFIEIQWKLFYYRNALLDKWYVNVIKTKSDIKL